MNLATYANTQSFQSELNVACSQYKTREKMKRAIDNAKRGKIKLATGAKHRKKKHADGTIYHAGK